MSERPAGDFTVVENIIAVAVLLFGVVAFAAARVGDVARTLFAGVAR